MNILILGSGGREYSIGLAIYKENAHNLYFMPGNGATDRLGTNINIKDYNQLAVWAKDNSIDLTIVGPEAPLVDGVVDIFKQNGLVIFVQYAVNHKDNCHNAGSCQCSDRLSLLRRWG